MDNWGNSILLYATRLPCSGDDDSIFPDGDSRHRKNSTSTEVTLGSPGRDPSPGPPRLVKAPVASHPLPGGEGKADLREKPTLSAVMELKWQPSSMMEFGFTTKSLEADPPWFLPMASPAI